jgi:exopolysaccharide production protein ExoY
MRAAAIHRASISGPLVARLAAAIACQRAPIGGLSKRVVDLIVAVPALVLLSPLLLLVAAAIRLTMGGPVLFAQQRIGYGGRRFCCYKFRSMRDGAEDVLDRHLAADPAATREWAEMRKLRNDPRVTPLGRLLRKSSLDELPQLWNVLRGEMSCVGPRPIVDDELIRYGAQAEAYLAARPGLTGLWQVSGRNRLSFGERVAIDGHYADSWSMRLDLSILPRTIPALLKFDETS